MTYQELLREVPFEDIVKPFKYMYPEWWHCLDGLRQHYDILLSLVPAELPENEQKAHIEYDKTDWTADTLQPTEDKRFWSLSAGADIEFYEWEKVIAKELIIADEVTESLAEIAACCLWHSSFDGFTLEQKKKRMNELEKSIEEASNPNAKKYPSNEFLEEWKRKLEKTEKKGKAYICLWLKDFADFSNKKDEELLNLETLDLSKLPTKLNSLPNEIQYLQNLKILNVSGHKLCTIPKGIGAMSNLKSLILSNNCIKKIPHTIGDLRNLENLQIDNNPLEDLVPNLIQLKNLRILNISNCKFKERPEVLEFIEDKLDKIVI